MSDTGSEPSGDDKVPIEQNRMRAQRLSRTRIGGIELERSSQLAGREPVVHPRTPQLQGLEKGRAFSIVIAEDTGRASFAVATNGFSVAAFGACTPMPSKR
jgi:hypothetical protein